MSDPIAGGTGPNHFVDPHRPPDRPGGPSPEVDRLESGPADPAQGPGSQAGSESVEGVSRKRRRGSRGGRRRAGSRPGTHDGPGLDTSPDAEASESVGSDSDEAGTSRTARRDPNRTRQRPAGRDNTEAVRPATEQPEASPAAGPSASTPDTGAQAWTIRPLESIPPPPGRPKIGDTRPAPQAAPGSTPKATRRRAPRDAGDVSQDPAPAERNRRRRKPARPNGAASQAPAAQPVSAVLSDSPVEIDEDTLEKRRGRERKGRPVGRYTMVVHSKGDVTQVAVLEGRSLIEHYVSRRADDANQIDGNIYLGRVQNVLPGMEAAFVDIGTPKNAVLYRGDVRYDKDDVETAQPGGPDSPPTRGKLAGAAKNARIEQLLKNGQTVLCQVVKNPIGTKGARLSQEVSLPGRFVVLIPGSDTYGISKRLADDERKRLRRILDDIRPAGHGLIVRTAAEGATADELRRDVLRLAGQWERIERLAAASSGPTLLYREPSMAVRVIREEFNKDYRSVVIDDRDLYDEVKEYVSSVNPELADRIEWSGSSDDPLPVFERYHIHEQVHKALDRKVWLPSGGSLIIERTEALTVIDVNTGKNVGTSNLEQTVFANNLEAAEEIARQLRLRDIGGIIVIDFIDMEIAPNRAEVMRTFRAALARDKTRTQVFDISELGLVEMTRKRISEGLIEAFSDTCPTCGGRGIVFDQSLL